MTVERVPSADSVAGPRRKSRRAAAGARTVDGAVPAEARERARTSRYRLTITTVLRLAKALRLTCVTLACAAKEAEMPDLDLPSSLPSVRTEMVERLRGKGLEGELGRVLGSVEQSIQSVNDSSSFLSPRSVLRVLADLPYDPDDTVYVLSRNDRRGFWTQGRQREYLASLTERAHARGYLNQVRVFVYRDDQANDLMPPDDVFFELQPLHAPGTLHSVGATLLSRQYPLLDQLRWGCTISANYQYAIIPVPPLDDPTAIAIPGVDIPELVARYPHYNASDGPMVAIICADQEYVGALTAELERLRLDAATLAIT